MFGYELFSLVTVDELWYRAHYALFSEFDFGMDDVNGFLKFTQIHGFNTYVVHRHKRNREHRHK